MRYKGTLVKLLLVGIFSVSLLYDLHAQHDNHASTSKSNTKWTQRVVLTQPLTSACPEMENVKMIEMTIPGGSVDTVKHRHTAQLIGYVLEGEIITKLKDKEPQVFKAGEAFYEFPDEIHEFLKNTSQVNRAVILLYYQHKKDAVLYTPLYKK